MLFNYLNINQLWGHYQKRGMGMFAPIPMNMKYGIKKFE
jgi:hypothetical protein